MKKSKPIVRRKKVVKVKGWCVLWREEVRKEYGVGPKERIIGVTACEDDYGVFVRHAIYETKSDAEKFCKENNDWEIIPVTISYEVPLRAKKK